jgi:hypothetical protein
MRIGLSATPVVVALEEGFGIESGPPLRELSARISLAGIGASKSHHDWGLAHLLEKLFVGVMQDIRSKSSVCW